MEIHRLADRALSQKAEDLIRFDVDSIRQVLDAADRNSPLLWLADPDQYERGGRVLRDSTVPRLLAYSRTSGVLYATDGCNACVHRPYSPETLPNLGSTTAISPQMIDRLLDLLATE